MNRQQCVSPREFTYRRMEMVHVSHQEYIDRSAWRRFGAHMMVEDFVVVL